jgi:multidrug resistance efflux pump
LRQDLAASGSVSGEALTTAQNTSETVSANVKAAQAALALAGADVKKAQLAKVRPLQPVTPALDLYGGRANCHGHVVGFSGGKGAEFSLAPAQNATGNGIEVVQRLSVRVALDSKELARRPQTAGPSMDATSAWPGDRRSAR